MTGSAKALPVISFEPRALSRVHRNNLASPTVRIAGLCVTGGRPMAAPTAYLLCNMKNWFVQFCSAYAR